MNVLRALSTLGAGLVLIASPVVLDPAGHGLPGWFALGGLLAVALMAASFLYVATVAPRLPRRPHERKLASLLLLVPAAGGLAMLATRQDPIQLMSSGVLVAFTVFLQIGVLFPDALGLEQRRLRRRTRREPSLLA
jgi:RsiW-degrading membrane proteinase PrsW (M82 family)